MLAIEMRDITKTFPGVVANDKICFSVVENEIHCLLGENGTGKSTLMNILFGLHKADNGEILINGEKRNIKNTKEAFELGIGMVHQHFMLVNKMTVVENIIIGKEKNKLFIDLKKSRQEVIDLANKYNFKIDVDEKVENLSVGAKQRVEILKTLYRGANIIILDEPTAVLTPQEVGDLFKILRSLKADGKTIIFITHKLNETMELSDRITVLRKGRNIATLNKTETDAKELARLMVGRDVDLDIDRGSTKIGQTVIEIENLKLQEKAKQPINLYIKEGEILGIAGVEGNGQLELEEIIMGLRNAERGKIFFKGNEITNFDIKNRKKLGIGYIPSDRHKRAMVSSFSIKENYVLGYQDDKQFVKNGFLKERTIKEYADKMIEKFSIKVASFEHKIGTLSGGNQQKVILSREVSHNPSLIVASQPVRGLDIGAIEYVHNTLINLKKEGKAILLISAELSEVLQLSDRIAVMYEGEIVKTFNAGELTREQVGLYMAGERE